MAILKLTLTLPLTLTLTLTLNLNPNSNQAATKSMAIFKVSLGYVLMIVLVVRALLTFNGAVWFSKEQPKWPELPQTA